MPLGNIFGLQFIVSQASSNLFDQACLLDENGNPVLDENGNCILMENGTGALAAPVIDGIPTLGGFEEIGSTLTATAAGVTGEPVPTRTWQWQRSLDGSTSWTPINVRENLLYQSNQFDTTWSTPSTDVTPNQSGYDGSTDAWLLEADVATSSANMNQSVSISGVMTASIYAKEGTTNWFRFSINDSGVNTRAWFDLSGSGAVGTTAGNIIDAKIESVGNGYFRCSITFNATAANVFLFITNADNSISYSVGDNIYIQDAQLEIGLTSTEYIESGATTGLSSYTTSADYTIQDSDDGYYLRVSQVETNTEGTDTAESIPTAFIATQETLAITNFTSRVEADGGSVESGSCLETDLTFLMNNPEPAAFTGLLNEYSGASAAYSLRLLDSTYSGNAVRVRRASDNTEQDIGFSNNELDTAALESFCSGTDGFVTIWYDQSGNGNNATQTTASKQAKIVSSGSTITQNGKPTLEFDSSSSQDFDVSISISTTEYSNFIVEASDDAPNTSTQVMYGVSTSVFYTRLRSIDLESRVSSSPIINLDDDFAYTTSQQYLISIINGASQGAHYIDGSIGNKSPKDTSTSGGITSSTLSIASANGAFYFNGKIQEMVFYFNDESTNQTGIETNINNFYSIY